MNDPRYRSEETHGPAMPDRRRLIAAGLGLAATSMLPGVARGTVGSQPEHAIGSDASSSGESKPMMHRRLGTLEVSALGLGCMNLR